MQGTVPEVQPAQVPVLAAPRRVANVDVLRAAAALAVLAIHAYSLGGRNAPLKAAHWYDVPLIALSSGVWLFFAISGYVITRPFVERLLRGDPSPSIVAYLLRRASRIYPLYWVALTALIVIEGTPGTKTWQLPVHYLLLNNLVPGRQEALFPAAWTLTLELLFYLAVPVLFGMTRAWQRRSSTPAGPSGLRSMPQAVHRVPAARRVPAERLAALVGATWLLSIAFTLVADLLGDGRAGLWLRGSLPAMWQMFCPGILLAIAPHLRADSGWRRWIVEFPAGRAAPWVATAALAAAALLSAAAPLRWGVVPYQVLVDASRPLFAFGFGLAVTAALRAPPWGERARWAVELGLISYGIYLLHPVLLALALDLGVRPVAGDSLPAFLLDTLFLGVLTIPLALLSWRCLEQPAIRLGRLGGRLWMGRSTTIAGVGDSVMRDFWNARAREDAFYFVDTRQRYKAPDPARFFEAEELVDYLLDGLGVSLRRADTVLEIGCGLGRITRVLAARAGAVIALDVSDEMLSRARELNPGLASVRWMLGDGHTLSGIEDSTVDACVSVVVFQHLPDSEITLGYIREVGRVLRPGGWAALQVSNDPAIHRPRDGLALRLGARVGLAPRGQRHPAWLGSWVDLDEVSQAATAASLVVERVWGAGSQYCQLLLRRNA